MGATAVILAAGRHPATVHPLLRPVAGRPLLARCISTAQASHGVTETVVCCDDPSLELLAKRLGARVVSLAQLNPGNNGDAPDAAATLLSLFSQLESTQSTIGAWVILDPYCPFTDPADIATALQDAAELKADVVASAISSDQLDNDGSPQEHDPNATSPLKRTPNFRVLNGAAFQAVGRLNLERFAFHAISEDSALCVRSTPDLDRAQWLSTRLGRRGPELPSPIDAVVFDFDGVFTANTVYLNQEGVETVRASRGDGLGIGRLKAKGIPCSVLSKEPNPVVLRRCEKLKIPCAHGVDDKLPNLQAWAIEHGFRLDHMIYVGNDVNDKECMAAVGCSFAVADALPDILAVADYVLTAPGGQGAVREVCELVLSALEKESN